MGRVGIFIHSSCQTCAILWDSWICDLMSVINFEKFLVITILNISSVPFLFFLWYSSLTYIFCRFLFKYLLLYFFLNYLSVGYNIFWWYFTNVNALVNFLSLSLFNFFLFALQIGKFLLTCIHWLFLLFC